MNRRNILGGAALAPAFIPQLRAAQKRLARNIIFMVSDGMSPNVLPLAEIFSKMARGRGTVWQELLTRRDVTRGMFDMASLNSPVTDSSSASSSWATGSRIFNAWINMLPDGTKLTPIGVLAHDKGKRVGLVTTATVTHATPAGFAAIEKSRDNEAGIAPQYRGVVDVVLGGGHRFFDPAQRKDGKDLYAWYREAGYTTCRTKKEMQAARDKQKLIGIFDNSHLPYTVDQLNDVKLQETVPTLAEMSRLALEILDRGREGFLVQIEGARVDHGAHLNDAAGLLWDQLAFDDAIRVALEFQAKRPDTLIVLCADHGNSSPSLRGMGVEYCDSQACFENMLKARGSYTPLIRALKDGPREAIERILGIQLTAEEAEPVTAAINRSRPTSINKQLNNITGTLGQVLSNHTGIAWVGESHTADYIVTTAVGPGADEFLGLVRNTDVFGKLTRMMGVNFKNPAMDPEAAKKFRAAVFRPHRQVHWA